MNQSLQLIHMNSVRSNPVDWLWQPFIPGGKLTVLDGDPGCGKSLITVDLAARLSRGGPLPDGTRFDRPRRTLLLNAEDALGDTVLPRLRAAGADLDQVFGFGTADGGISAARLPRDVPAVEALVRAKAIDLVVIDPLMAFLPPEVAANLDQSVRQALLPLAALAARTGAAVLLVRHLTKRGGRALYRGSGSLGIVGAARSGLLAARDPRPEGGFVLATTKANLGGPAVAQSYRIEGDSTGVASVAWLGAAGQTADVLCEAPRREEKGQLAAAEWLLGALAAGGRPAAELLGEAKAAGFGERTLEKAKRQLRVRSKVGYREGRRHWLWEPPPVPTSPLEPWHEAVGVSPPEEDDWDEAEAEARAVLQRDQLDWAQGLLRG